MSRVPYAMNQFIKQVAEHHPKAKYRTEEEDGLGVYRRLSYDQKTSVWLEPFLAVMRDERIQNHFTSRGGMAMIDFVNDFRAEHVDPFSLPYPEPVKKAPAKKAAPKKETQAATKKAKAESKSVNIEAPTAEVKVDAPNPD